MNMKKIFAASLLALLAAGCSRENIEPGSQDYSEIGKIVLSGSVDEVYQTRVDDNGFADGDRIGIYVVDYDGENPGTLKSTGNRADNVWHKYHESTHSWESARDIYWKDKKTSVDIYGYYPFSNVDDVSAYSFEVAKNQTTDGSDGSLPGYEASDFLWGKSEKIAPTGNRVNVSMTHRLSAVRVTLAEGTGFATGEWKDASKSILLTGFKRNAQIDMATGIASVVGEVDASGIIPRESSGEYRAVVVPQTISAKTPLISITIDGGAYKFSKDEDLTFNASKQHNFTITVNKRPEGDFELVLSNESITAWENDSVTHGGVAREYVVVNVETPGTLDECITSSGKDLTKVRNLKLTGSINSRDFAVMKKMMTNLNALNLKEVKIVKGNPGNIRGKENGIDYTYGYSSNNEDCIPSSAMDNKLSLTSLILPDKLVEIGVCAFAQCTYLTGNLILPEGLVRVRKAAFRECKNLNSLVLPSTLTDICSDSAYTSYWDGAFALCSGLCCELNLPEGLTVVGMGAFYACSNLYGNLKLPESLTTIGNGAFDGCQNLTGSITIPQGVTIIQDYAFNNCGFNGTLTLHNGIVAIGVSAFASHFRGELVLPKNLEVVSDETFYGCDFSGKLVLPEDLRVIGRKAFANNWRLSGVVEIPENVISISEGAFANCRSLEGVILPEGLETIRYTADWGDTGGAFQNCFALNRIICKGTMPPYVQQGAFDGVSKNNFTVEVPESAVVQYQVASGWKDFKRISAYRNLSVSNSVLTAINTSVTRDFVLYADDEWEVAEQPEWAVLNCTSGKGKTKMSVTFSQMPAGANREGKVVFKLKNDDYKVSLSLLQCDYKYAEDEILTLQSAAKGNGINIMFLGDGYNAKEVSEGTLLNDVQTAVEHFFSIEPYKTYKDYFNVYTGIAVSSESGIGGVNTIVYNRFNTTAKGGVTLGGVNDSDFAEILKYACKAPTISEDNLGQTLVVMIPNTSDYGGICYMYDDGSAIAYCPKSDYGYPLDFRGVIQHEAGGHGFGKLGDEYIYHNTFIDACSCTCCPHVEEFNNAKMKGWYDNLSLSGKVNGVPWSHLVYHENYKNIVDVYEGGFMHNRGVYRSEYNSCMNNDIPYYSTVSRESIVKRIKAYAGEEYSFDDFVANDKIENLPETASLSASKFSVQVGRPYVRGEAGHHAPVFLGARPKIVF